MLSSFVKLTETHEGVPIHLKEGKDEAMARALDKKEYLRNNFILPVNYR